MLYLKIEASGNSTGLSWPPQYYQTCLIFTIQNLDDCIRSFWADCYKQSSPLSSQRSCWCCQATVIILGLGANISSHAIVDRNLKSHLQFSQQNSKPGLPTHPDAFNLLLFSSSFFFFSQQRVTTRSCCTMPVIILFISASPWDHMTGITTDSLLNSWINSPTSIQNLRVNKSWFFPWHSWKSHPLSEYYRRWWIEGWNCDCYHAGALARQSVKTDDGAFQHTCRPTHTHNTHNLKADPGRSYHV